MERETFVFYKDWLNVIRDLPSEVQLEVYQAITEYAIYSNLIELKPLAKVAFGFVKQTIDRDTQKYISIKEKRKEAGAKGGRPLKTNELEESKDKQKNQLVFEKSKKSKSPLNVNVNDNVNDISFLEKKKQKSTRTDFGEEENNQPLNAQKETSPPVAPAPPPFNFRKAMLSEGFAPELVDEWLKIRKAKKAVNTERALKAFVNQVQQTNQDINTVLSIIVQKQWKGFEADWLHSAQAPLQSPQQTIIDEYGNIITPTNHYTPPSGKPPYVAGRQTAENIRNNMQGWGAHTFGNS
uniref:DUF6291 domain-containing protein n=1 Tax=Siphoviridae sp. ctRNB7 TaxID=2825502 RepID=A0A8S5PVK0_9CAUD|nr:MAG TPA: hypothetical protein [Siphoviridae sp. ctRNB7]